MQAYAALARVAAARDGYRTISLVLLGLLTREQFGQFKAQMDELEAGRGQADDGSPG